MIGVFVVAPNERVRGHVVLELANADNESEAPVRDMRGRGFLAPEGIPCAIRCFL